MCFRNHSCTWLLGHICMSFCWVYTWGGIAGYRFCCIQPVFQSGCTNLHTHQQCRSVPVAPYPPQYLVVSGKMYVTLVGMNNSYFLLRFHHIPSSMLSNLPILCFHLSEAISPFFWLGNWQSKKLSYCPKAPNSCVRNGIQSQLCMTSKHVLFS